MGLSLEATEAVFVLGKVSRQDLDRHLAAQVGVVREIHFAHSAGAEQRLDLIPT